MWSTTMACLLLLLFLSFASAFKNVLVLVVQDNSYLSAIRGKGQLADYYYGDLNTSVVSIIQNRSDSWTVYIDKYAKCSLDPRITIEYNYLISASDVNDEATLCAHVDNSNNLVNTAKRNALSKFSFYFPDPSNAGRASWLRSSLYPALSSPKYLATTLTLIITPGQTSSHVTILILGKDALLPPNPEAVGTWWSFLEEYFVGLTWVAPPPPSPTWFDRIFFVVLENQPENAVLKHQYMRDLAASGTLLLDYNALINPSQPNYVALIAGDTMGVTDDAQYDIEGRNLIDLFEEQGISWKAYMENYPENCYDGERSVDLLYVRKHNPFMSFNSIRQNGSRCAKIVNSEQLFIDIDNNALPRYMFYTPNMDNDGHDTSIAYSSKWLGQFLPRLLTNDVFMQGTLVVVTYDEGIRPHNRIYTVFLGDMVPFGNVDNTSYTHYSMLRLVEDEFQTGNLGRKEVNAPKITPSNFYPGDVPIIKSKIGLYVGIGVGGFLIAFALVATFYYFFVIRRKKRSNPPHSPFISLNRSREEREDEEDGFDDAGEDEEEVERRSKWQRDTAREL